MFDGEPERILVELDVAADDERPGAGLRGGGAADDVLYPKHQLVDVEGFGNIIVRANLETVKTIGLFIAGGQEKEGDAETRLDDLVCQFEAIHLGHGNVDKGQVKACLGIFKLLERDPPILRPGHLEANDFQVLFDDISQIDLIFNQKYL